MQYSCLYYFVGTFNLDFELLNPPFISLSTFTGEPDTLDTFIRESMSQDEFFFQTMSLPIMETFYFCVVVDEIDDKVIEGPEWFLFVLVTRNDDVFGANDSTSAIVTLQIMDDDGMYLQCMRMCTLCVCLVYK